MKNKGKIVIVLIIIFFIGVNMFCPMHVVFANMVEDIYSVFDDYGSLILQKQNVFEGDMFMTKDFKKYEIVEVDEVNKTAKAKFLSLVKKPEVNISFTPQQINQLNPVICLYMTHNDESYVTGDGVDSVYGKGGIHDVAKAIQKQFQNQGVNTYISEDLHIPHDTKAYSRSNVTAKNMINQYSPDGIFDIHRDGASRSTYVKKVNGVDRCKVRIVVGKASSNFEIAEQFALYLMSVSEQVCDWLFLDIYYAQGHYNQGLHNKALLFEMGSHLVEKSLVLKSVEPLVNVVTTAMFKTTVDSESGQLTVNGGVTEDTPLLNDAIDILAEEKHNNEKAVPYVMLGIIAGTVVLIITTLSIYTKKRK